MTIFESIKELEIKTSMLFNLDFANNSTILSCLFICLYFLIPGVITQIFTPLEELVIYIEIPTNEAKAEMETTSSSCRN